MYNRKRMLIGVLGLFSVVLGLTVQAENIYVSLDGSEANTGKGGLKLVDNKMALCTIVTGEEDGLETQYTRFPDGYTKIVPEFVLQKAATDLADYLHEMGGIWDPKHMVRIVKKASDAKTTYRILLGTAAIETYGLQEEATAHSYVGYTYRTIGNDLLIFGASSKGTANGVYGFLQDELGVRWFGPAPEDIFTVVPELKTVKVGLLNKTVEPSFYGRPYKAKLEENAGDAWARRMRKGGTEMPFQNASHNLLRIFPVKSYFEDHPEYYYMRDGKRRYYKASHVWSVCYSNPEVADIAAEQAINYFRASSYHQSFSVGINDCRAYCECPACAKLQPKRSYAGGRVASDMYYHFVNEVARRTAKEFPDRYIGAIAYNDVTAAPIGEMETNVFVVIVNDISEYFDADYRKREEALVASWEKKDIVLGMYYYLYLAKIVPASFPRHLAAELKARYNRGFRVLFNEIPFWPCGLMSYVDARLWWDVELDVEQLIDEYFSALYGSAAEYMKELYDLFEEIHMRPRKGGFLYEHYKIEQFRPYTAEDLAKMKKLIQQAHTAIDGMGIGYSFRERPEERRLAYTTRNLKVFMEMLEGLVLAQDLNTAEGELDDIEIMSRLAKIERINTLINRHERLFRETIILDPCQSTRYRIDTCTPVRNAWKNKLTIAVGYALVDIYRYIDKAGAVESVEGRVTERMDQEIDIFAGDERRAALFNYRIGKIEPEENRIINPGFELTEKASQSPSAALADKLNWQLPEIPGWAWWQVDRETGSFGISDQERHSGKHSAVLVGTGRAACAIAVVSSVRKGDIYRASAFVKNPVHATREDKPTVSLNVAWLDEENHWTQHGQRFSVKTDELDRWVELELVVEIPKGAATAVVQVNAKPLYGEEKVFVDDFSFRRLPALKDKQ